ncbi:transcriptional regulator, ArsR family [Desulfonauticus submarinus]|uniref:Transcriptional regulator, ArsR family n=1 Tax=Desulfonauticus submarinus TaxID=206665 RepID=A0A1H0D7N1_9BACT|nr:metalloregulator ArsR/SmtB family transcription factor [Desulfonauticus submarinus]SDN66177.1 transcriptional regulator, ArsR family [Desulfonauticus submarinus]
MKLFLKVMKALAEENRVKILKMLEKGERCVCEIQAVLGLAQPTISKHLKILEDAGLVKSRKQGMWVLYRLSIRGEGNEYSDMMLSILKRWLNEDKEVDNLLIKLENIIRDCQRR